MLHESLPDRDFFRLLAKSGARALLIGRRALVLHGAPVLTSDYELWLSFEDVEKLNAAFQEVDHFPNCDPATARTRDQYVIENGERIDVMIARSASDSSGVLLTFEDAWHRRVSIELEPGLSVSTPCIDDLILTKRWGSRPKDLLDIEFLEALRRKS